MRFGPASVLYDGPPSPSKPVGETNSDGFGEPSYGFQDTFSVAKRETPPLPPPATTDCLRKKAPDRNDRIAERIVVSSAQRLEHLQHRLLRQNVGKRQLVMLGILLAGIIHEIDSCRCKW